MNLLAFASILSVVVIATELPSASASGVSIASIEAAVRSSPKSNACAAAASALDAAASQFRANSEPKAAPAVRVGLPPSFDAATTTTLGSTTEDGWRVATPSPETASLYLAEKSSRSAYVCPNVRAKARSLGFGTGLKAEQKIDHLNRRYPGAGGWVLEIAVPVVNQAGDEALTYVAQEAPYRRAGSGWLYLLRRYSSGQWKAIDRVFLWVG